MIIMSHICVTQSRSLPLCIEYSIFLGKTKLYISFSMA